MHQLLGLTISDMFEINFFTQRRRIMGQNGKKKKNSAKNSLQKSFTVITDILFRFLSDNYLIVMHHLLGTINISLR